MSPIENLSWELLGLILSFVPKNDDPLDRNPGLTPESPSILPLYATVCKSWVDHIERRTFQTIRLKSTELEEFSGLLNSRRVAALSRLSYEVVLPTYSENACAKFETQKDQENNDIAFTDAIVSLFKCIKSWDMDEDNQPEDKSSNEPGSLEFVLSDIYSPMDEIHRGREVYEEDRRQWELGRRHDLWNLRYKHSFLKLLKPETLPAIFRFSKFSKEDGLHRNVAPASLALMASKFPNMQAFQCICSDDEKKYPEVRQQLRYGKF